jgi:hypothetical protein
VQHKKTETLLPSRKVILFGIVLVIGGLIIFWYQSGISLSTDNSRSDATGTTTNEIAQLKNQDSDSDGLNDWEEQLWGTDPESPDTDGDGTEDGREVENNRDPTEPGPNDQLAPASTSTDTLANQNLTRTVTTEFLPDAGVIAAASNEGQAITQNDLERLSSAAAGSNQLQSAEVSQRDELKIAQNYQPADVDQYFDRLVNAQRPVDNPDRTNPLTVVAQAIQSGQDNVDLTPYISQHQTAIDRLKSMTVPDRFAASHLEILQSIERMLFALQKLNRMQVDPVGSVVGIQEFKEGIRQNQQAAELLNEEINNYAQYVREN